MFAGGCAEVDKFTKPGHADSAVAWGEAKDGLQIGVARRTYEPGREPAGKPANTVYYAMVVRNVGKGELKFMWPGEPGFGSPVFPLAGDESVRVTAVYSPGGEAKHRYSEVRPTKKPAVAPLEPGVHREFEFRLTPGKFGVGSMSGGRFWAVYSNQQATIDYGQGNGGVTSGVWTGEVKSGEIAVP
jgi:hypothetical protein